MIKTFCSISTRRSMGTSPRYIASIAQNVNRYYSQLGEASIFVQRSVGHLLPDEGVSLRWS
jgi:hypothetical protein